MSLKISQSPGWCYEMSCGLRYCTVQCPTALLHRVNTNNGDKIKQMKTRQKCSIHSTQHLVSLCLSVLSRSVNRLILGPIKSTSVPPRPIGLLACLMAQPRDRQSSSFGLLRNRGDRCCSCCLMVSAITLASRLLMYSPPRSYLLVPRCG